MGILVAFSSRFCSQTIVLFARHAPRQPTGRERLRWDYLEGVSVKQIRVRDLVVLAIIVLIGSGSFLYHWVQSFQQARAATDIESRALMRDEFQKANAGPPFRNWIVPNLSLQVTSFRSGPQDTIRTEKLGMVCSVEDVDVQHGYFVCLKDRQSADGYEWSNIRFCNHLTLMGNPRLTTIEEKLQALPAWIALEQLAVPLLEPQSDGPYAFSQLQLVQADSEWVLRGQVLNQSEIRAELSVFHCEWFAGEQVGNCQFVVERLQPLTPTDFTCRLPESLARSITAAEQPQLKIVLELATNRQLRR